MFLYDGFYDAKTKTCASRFTRIIRQEDFGYFFYTLPVVLVYNLIWFYLYFYPGAFRFYAVLDEVRKHDLYLFLVKL